MVALLALACAKNESAPAGAAAEPQSVAPETASAPGVEEEPGAAAAPMAEPSKPSTPPSPGAAPSPEAARGDIDGLDAAGGGGGPSCVGHNCPPPAPSREAKAKGSRADKKPSAIGSSVRLVGEPKLGGGLRRDLIRRSTESHVDDLAACHREQLQYKPDIAGELVVTLTIDEDGNVSKAELGEASNLGNSVIEQCVLSAIEGWRFDAPDGDDASVELRLDFSPE